MTDEVDEVSSTTLFSVHSTLEYTDKSVSKKTTILIQSQGGTNLLFVLNSLRVRKWPKNFSTEYSRADILCATYSKLYVWVYYKNQ